MHRILNLVFLLFLHILRAMVGTRNSQKAGDEDEKAIRLRNQEPEASDSDSDDAPEEVGFVASKKVRLMRANELEFK